jgi:ketopantoate reductase PanE/ApbA-like protein
MAQHRLAAIENQRRPRLEWRRVVRVRSVSASRLSAPAGSAQSIGAALAKAGGEVVFVARCADLAAMRENGLRIVGDRGETLIRPARATDDMTRIGIVDCVLCCVTLRDSKAPTSRSDQSSGQRPRLLRCRTAPMRPSG